MSDDDDKHITGRRPFLCAAGFHDDATDAFGGYSPTCLRCGGPSWAGPTPTFRGSLMAVIGVGMIFLGLLGHAVITAIVLGALLFLGGLAVIIWQRP